jgi:DNA replication and repair protein RecF
VPLIELGITNFRCIESAEISVGSRYNLIVGPNASGKTSILEAIGYLGRGRSFRGAASKTVVRHGCEAFVVVGRVSRNERVLSVGIQGGRDGLRSQVDGNRGGGSSGLVEQLPLQVIDPDIHNLVAGGPEERRRYLDWIGFHVERGFLEVWRRFSRALKQRNAALRDGASGGELRSWDQEFSEAAAALDQGRRNAIAAVAGAVRHTGLGLLGGAVDLDYRRGWAAEGTMGEALAQAAERDRRQGQSTVGPQRADVKLIYDERQARKLVSRGQQKLLACTLVLAASAAVQEKIGGPILLLLDDPAAELDARSLERLMASVGALGCQVVATALEADRGLFPEPPVLFHVERGAISRAA